MARAKQRIGHGLPDQAPQARPHDRDSGRRALFANVRGDFVGGTTAALLAIPISMGYGILALSPLGAEAIPFAALAGLYALLCGGLTALALGANTTMIYAPRSIASYLFAALALHQIVQSPHPFVQAASFEQKLAIVFIFGLLAGGFQILFGLLRLGSLVRYVAAPVMGGFQNAAALLIFVAQIPALLGLPGGHSLQETLAAIPHFQPLTLAAGVITAVFMLNGAQLSRRIPPSLLGLIAGVAAYYLFAAVASRDAIGPVIGTLPTDLPWPRFVPEFIDLLSDPGFYSVLPGLASAAASLAVVASLDALLCARLITQDSGQRLQGNRELVRLGAGNMVSACFGGISNGFNLASSFANHRGGARGPLSILFSCGAVLVGLLALPPVIALLPRTVIAGVLAAVAIQLVDRRTLKLLGNLLLPRRRFSQSMGVDLAVICATAAIAIAVNIVVAVAFGIAVTVVFFLLRMSQSAIRREFRCTDVRSRRAREVHHLDILTLHGRRILVIELEGPFFFGSAEKLAQRVDATLDVDIDFVIVDIRRVNEIDSTGARILVETHDRLTRHGRHLLLSGLAARPELAVFLRDMGVTAALTQAKVFDDTDGALEWAEDRLILGELGAIDAGAEFPFAQLPIFAGMSAADLAAITPRLQRRVFKRGEIVFREGAPGREMFIIAKGTASVHVQLPGTARTTRLVTFSPGTAFGELALLDRGKRSATVEADGYLVCHVLPLPQFDAIAREHPAAAIRLLHNLDRELAARLRLANRTIHMLAG